ncbi:hypothetical protein ACOME3_003976 [Neoechinorhynchus agilis]
MRPFGIKEDYLKDISNCACIPRVSFEDFDLQSVKRLNENSTLYSNVKHKLFKLLALYEGLVLDFGPLLLRFAMPSCIKILRDLRSYNRTLVIAISPVSKLRPLDYETIGDFVSLISLGMYDYQTVAGPLAPIHWIEEVLTKVPLSVRNKTLLGLNFYGYKWAKDGLSVVTTQADMMELLKRKHKISWNEQYEEHFFENNQHLVAYPTGRSIAIRVELANRMKMAGVAAWEIGQGFDYFMHLL